MGHSASCSPVAEPAPGSLYPQARDGRTNAPGLRWWRGARAGSIVRGTSSKGWYGFLVALGVGRWALGVGRWVSVGIEAEKEGEGAPKRRKRLRCLSRMNEHTLVGFQRHEFVIAPVWKCERVKVEVWEWRFGS